MRVNVDFRFFQTEELLESLESAGWRIEEATERDPYPGWRPRRAACTSVLLEPNAGADEAVSPPRRG
jgi:hypothetical protein